jgi:protein-glucosylgalactosylhydroxylysine glucosidase
MFPPLALLQPKIATSLMEYRVLRIPAAMTKALSYDPPYAGAMFPWESAVSGVEVCPTWAATGQLEQHISGDIVFAARTLYEVTGNQTWLANEGYALASGVADWIKSRVSYDDQGAAHIQDVIPPDEYAEGDDSVSEWHTSVCIC